MAIRNRKLTSRLAHYQSEPAPIPRPTRRKRKNTFTAGGVVCLCVLCLLCYYGLSGTLTMPPESNKNGDASSYLIKPLVVGCYFTDDPQGIMAGSRIVRMRRLKIYDEDRYPSKRQMEWTKENEDNEAQLRDSRKYKRGLPQEREDEKCALRYEWQKRSYPTCNSIHETDFTEFYNDNGKVVDENSRIVASGFFRDVWKMSDNRDGISWIAAKTLRSIHPFTARNFDRHRRDALAAERTSSSLHTLDMYSFCGHTVMTEFAEKGSLNDIIWPMNGNCTLSIKERLHYAMEVAKGLEALQFVDTPDAASIVHTDIRPAQLLLGGDNNSLKLNDFNRAFFIAFDRKTGSPCSFRVGNNPGKFRSPEEYSYFEESEKIDVYSMGNVFYSLLTELWPFQDITEDQAQDKVIAGERPSIPMENTTEPYAMALIHAIKMCWTHHPSQRPSVKDVIGYIEKAME